MHALAYLSQTTPILWVAESDWGYPIVLTLHSIGMALVVGIVLMFDLRVIGMGQRVPAAAINSFFPFAWIGFAINVISGSLLFCANYSAFLHNTAFITKLTLLAAAASGTWLLVRRYDKEGGSMASFSTRALALVCLILLLCAITAGRIIGYTSVPE